MKALLLAASTLVGMSTALAGTPSDLWMQTTGMFDGNHILSGSFTSTGAIERQGSFVDSPRLAGQSIHIVRSMTTSKGEYITIEINSNHVKGTANPPSWCPLPPSMPPGAMLAPQAGSWVMTSVSGLLPVWQGTGSWASWVVYDPNLGLPVSATECLSGKVQ